MSCTEVSTSRTERREKESVVEGKVGSKINSGKQE
jgi:hypothetical protein